MTAADLLAALRAAGFAVSCDAGRLLVSPRERLTDDWRSAIRQHRDGLLALVAAEGDTRPFALPPPGAGIPAAEYAAFWRWVEAFNDKPVGHLMHTTKLRRVRRDDGSVMYVNPGDTAGSQSFPPKRKPSAGAGS